MVRLKELNFLSIMAKKVEQQTKQLNGKLTKELEILS